MLLLRVKAADAQLNQVYNEDVRGVNKIKQVFQERSADKSPFAVVQRNRQKRKRNKAEVVEQQRCEYPEDFLFAEGVQQNNKRQALNFIIRVQEAADYGQAEQRQ